MPRKFALTRQLIIMLSIWVCVWGMAAVDLFDLTDELLQPMNIHSQLIEPELDDLDDEGSPDSAAALAQIYINDLEGASILRAVAFLPIPSSRPLYQQLTQYRI